MIKYDIFKLIEGLYIIVFDEGKNDFDQFQILVKTNDPHHFAKLYRSIFSSYDSLAQCCEFYIFYQEKVPRLMLLKEEAISRQFHMDVFLDKIRNDTSFIDFLLFNNWILTDLSKLEECLNVKI
jgi:hypothetical protein